MNKRLKRNTIISLLVFLCATLCSTIGISFAWLSGATTEVNVEQLTGGVISQYFHCGSGAENDPFVITRPVHLYNLTQLYTLEDTFADEGYYFQLGYDLENNGSLEFYTYGDDGKIVEDSYSTSLNMNYYDNFTPIGSEDNPFNGTFDGSDLTINKLNISGDGLSDIGVFGYVTDAAEVKNLYLDNLTIDVDGAVVDAHDPHNTNAYVGYIAGHIEDSTCFTNTYINHCRITGQSCLIHNDWGYFGKCENASTLEDFVSTALNGAQGSDWGGSVNMKDMYNRLYSIAGSATTNSSYAFEKDIVTRANGTTFERGALTGYAYTYRSQLEGSFVFSRYSSSNGPRSNYIYLNGGTRYHQYAQTETQVAGGYNISYDGHYLGVSGTNLADHQDAWQFSNNLLSIYIDGTQYYLTHNLSLSTTTQETWTKNNNQLYYETGGIFGLFTTKHYLYYNNGWTTRTSSINLTWTNAYYTRVTESSSGADYMDYTGTNVTYFPLITEDNNYNVRSKNTGYVIGGSEDNTTAAYPDKTGDIRVSKYSTSDINASYSGGTLTNVYTINSSLRTVGITESDYVKYNDSKTQFLDMVSDGNVYGLHFMPANINIDHLVTADYALINGDDKYNYEMPASSIDFKVKKKGSINFFAGTYFSGNNSFFSLHHIERDANDHITSIKEIKEIYSSSNQHKNNIYKYDDNTYSAALTADYSLAFSTDRIKIRENNSNWQNNAVYYFEIPANKGEYALGSVDQGTGAYLMYLDIGTSGTTLSDADDFGTVEYRSSPDIVDHSILLLTYEQTASQNIDILVVYIESEKRYNITYSGNLTSIKVTQLNVSYEIYFNGSMLPQEIQTNIV